MSGNRSWWRSKTMIETKNAVILRTSIDVDRGALYAWLHLDYGGASQGFGGYSLYHPHFPTNANYAGHFIWRVLEILDVSAWSEVTGQCIRVRASQHKVESIGHIIKDVWFDPEKEFADLRQLAGE